MHAIAPLSIAVFIALLVTMAVTQPVEDAPMAAPRAHMIAGRCWKTDKRCEKGAHTVHPLGQEMYGCQGISGNKGLSWCPNCAPRNPDTDCMTFLDDDCIHNPNELIMGCILMLPRKVIGCVESVGSV